MFFANETTIRLNTVKGLVWNLGEKKKIARTVKHSSKVYIWSYSSSRSFGCIVCFKQNFNTELIYDIYKRGTVRKQFGFDSTTWELQEDNDVKHMWQVALKWKARHGIEKID